MKEKRDQLGSYLFHVYLFQIYLQCPRFVVSSLFFCFTSCQNLIQQGPLSKDVTCGYLFLCTCSIFTLKITVQIFVLAKHRYMVSDRHTRETKGKEITKYVHICIATYMEKKKKEEFLQLKNNSSLSDL